MTHVIAFANQKGGVGKTTLCIQAAYFLAGIKGAKVLVIDMDGQGNSSSRLAPVEEDEHGYQQPVYSGTRTAELFRDDLEEIEVMECPGGIDLIHSTKNDIELYLVEGADSEVVLRPAERTRELLKQYDYVLIDCSPSLGRNLIAALAMSTHVLMPIKLSGFALDGVEGLFGTVVNMKNTFNPGLAILGVVVNDMDRSMNHEKAYEQLQQYAGPLLFNNRIMHRPPLDTASSIGMPIWELQYGHVAIKEVEGVLEEMLERLNEQKV